MCGVAGIMTNSGAPPERALLAKMSKALVHRGPDGEGVHFANNVGLTQRRLAIIDLKTGDQPFFSREWGAGNEISPGPVNSARSPGSVVVAISILDPSRRGWVFPDVPPKSIVPSNAVTFSIICATGIAITDDRIRSLRRADRAAGAG